LALRQVLTELDPETRALWRYVHECLGSTPDNPQMVTALAIAIPHAYGVHPCVYRTDGIGPCLVGRLIAEELHGYHGADYDESWRP
jgi:hypothetical protein